MSTRYPHGLKTSAIEAESLSISGNAEIGGTLTPATVIGGGAAKAISVDCTNSIALATSQKNATLIDITASGSSKVLTLGMTAGQIVAIKNSGANNVTVKNIATDNGVAATAKKTALFLITSGEPVKVTADV